MNFNVKITFRLKNYKLKLITAPPNAKHKLSQIFFLFTQLHHFLIYKTNFFLNKNKIKSKVFY